MFVEAVLLKLSPTLDYLRDYSVCLLVLGTLVVIPFQHIHSELEKTCFRVGHGHIIDCLREEKSALS